MNSTSYIWEAAAIFVGVICLLMIWQISRRQTNLEHRQDVLRDEHNALVGKVEAQEDIVVRAFDSALSRHIKPLQESLDQARRDMKELTGLVTSVIENRGNDEAARTPVESLSR